MSYRTPITIQEEVERARGALRGEAAYQAIGFENPRSAPTPAAEQSSLLHQVISITTAGTFDLVQGLAGQRIHIMEFFLYTDTSMQLELFDGSSSITGPLKAWPASTGMFWQDVGTPHYSTSPGSALKLTTGAAGQVSGFVRYRMG